ncbi:DUF6122 family protein [Olivibacter sp. 47]|uniref:DUF6122 family protein n=1 Tax=Olivibacter sp. 47 TaxID=3056486 RepID=UPI0025A41C89|nr:DUF6122 family protein [Olivibacter sp. 47]MDM8174521.1 DUF6122 family protein [Olivibacter sp. 47]
MITLNVLQTLVHYSLHFLFPGLLARLFFKKEWKKAWAIMVATMLVDLDHLLSKPIFDANRCSIGYHPLHTNYAIAFYMMLLFFPRTRIVAVGLLFHMLTDYQDCIWREFLSR